MFIEKLSDETYLEFQMKYADTPNIRKFFLEPVYFHMRHRSPSSEQHPSTLLGYLSVINPREEVVTAYEPDLDKHFVPIREYDGEVWVATNRHDNNDTFRGTKINDQLEEVKNNLMSAFFFDHYLPNKTLTHGIRLEKL